MEVVGGGGGGGGDGGAEIIPIKTAGLGSVSVPCSPRSKMALGSDSVPCSPRSKTGLGSDSAPGSPRSKIKFMCSHGGKILPRPADRHLKYVGGETRVVSVTRDISFTELMKKLASLSDGDNVLKYQLLPEDLDALVTVKSDDDLRHMLDEYDRCESAGNPKLRAFLFPANPIVVVDNPISPLEPQALEQRYIDAVNGIVRTAAASTVKQLSLTGNPQSSGTVSSNGSSPKSPESCIVETAIHESIQLKAGGQTNSRAGMHRVHSSPSISSLSSQQQSNIPPMHHNHQYHHHQNYQHNYQQGYPSPRAHLPERLVSVMSVGKADSWKYQVVPGPSNYYPVTRHGRGSRCYCSNCMHFDEYGAYRDRKFDRAESPFRSPPQSRSPM